MTRFLAKRQLKKEVSAALVIQKCWRRFLQQRKLLMLRKAELEKIQNKSALVIQVQYAGILNLKSCNDIGRKKVRYGKVLNYCSLGCYILSGT